MSHGFLEGCNYFCDFDVAIFAYKGIQEADLYWYMEHWHLRQYFIALMNGEDVSNLFLSLPSALPLLSHFKRDSDFCHVRPTSVTCSSLSSPAMVPYVCQNVYVVCFFQPDLFPCLLSNEPHSPRGSELMPHAIYTDRTAGALPAKAARDG